VFVGEQNVKLAEERDEYDAAALHFLAFYEGRPAGTARVILLDDAAKITRVAVQKFARGKGVGLALMRHIETSVRSRRFILDAQIQALAFYESLGYAPYGEIFMEAGIAHRRMRKDLLGISN
jgi:ElaA protein